MHLVDDVNAVLPHLGWDTHLIDEQPDIIHRVVTGSIKLMNVERTVIVERFAGITLITSLYFRRQILAVDGFGKNPCTGGFSNTTGPTKQVGMCQLFVFDGIFKCDGNIALSFNRIERGRSVFPG